MTMVSRIIRRFLESRRRRLNVIILTCAVGLVTLWPAVDEYFALADYHVQLVQSLAQAHDDAAELPVFEARAAERSMTLATLERQTVAADEIRSFRDELVEMIRRSGCQVRRMELDRPRRRVWKEKDHPLNAEKNAGHDDEEKATPYQLRSQMLSLAVSGNLGQVNELLKQIREADKLMRTYNFSLQPVDEDRTKVILEMEIQLFDLEEIQGNDSK